MCPPLPIAPEIGCFQKAMSLIAEVSQARPCKEFLLFLTLPVPGPLSAILVSAQLLAFIRIRRKKQCEFEPKEQFEQPHILEEDGQYIMLANWCVLCW